MALWGNQDSKTASGTIAINATTGAVTGTSTAFTTQAKLGNYIRVSGEDYQIVKITSDTSAKVIAGKNGATMTAVNAGASYTLSTKPAFVAHESQNGVNGDATKVFGVNAAELSAGSDNVVEVAVVQGGSGYAEAPVLTINGGGGSSATATATISGGKVTSYTVTNVGSAYTSRPTVAVNIPVLTIPTARVITANDSIAYIAHTLSANDAVLYKAAGSTAITGVANNTTFYVATAGLTANAFKIKATNVAPGTLAATVATSGTGGQFTCGASALAVGDRVTITGTLGGTGTITGYTSGTTYKVSAITGTTPNITGFTLQTDAGGAITTTAGTLTGLTYTVETVIDMTGTGNGNQYFEIVAGTRATATAALGSGTGSGATHITHAGWVRRSVGTGGRAGRIQYETLVAMSPISGDQSDDIQLPD
jgi:hypothetical protein